MKRLAITILTAWLVGSAQADELHLQITDAAGAPVQDAALWLKPLSGAVPAAPASPAHATIDQMARTFRPLLSVIRTGTPVDFPNSDNIRHSVYSFSAPRTFTLKLYSGKPSAPIVFDKEGFVTLGCNIHDQMIAWVVVVSTPWFARSGGDGAAHITGVPEGQYQLYAWHPGLKGGPVTQNVRVASDTQPLALRLDASPLASLLPDSEGQVPHAKEH